MRLLLGVREDAHLLGRFYLSHLLIATLVTSVYVGFNFIPTRVNLSGEGYGWPAPTCVKLSAWQPYEFFPIFILFNIVIGLGLFAVVLYLLTPSKSPKQNEANPR